MTNRVTSLCDGKQLQKGRRSPGFLKVLSELAPVEEATVPWFYQAVLGQGLLGP